MIIQPDGNIYILRECPLTNSYEHTLYWNNNASQLAYFTGLSKHKLTNQSYQRYAKGVLTVQVLADNLYDCNYLMFQNSGFGSKWFYAFITSIEYVNNVTSRITYEVDVMQTWYFDCNLNFCFVEREHSVTDEIGENVVPENLDLGEYTTYGATTMNELQEHSIIVASTYSVSDGKLNRDNGAIYSHVYSGLFFNVFPATDAGVEAVNTFLELDSLLTGGSSVVSIFMMPTKLVATGKAADGILDKYIDKKYAPFGDYTPKNKKLYTYPYNFLYVSNLQGNSAVYKYERFDSEDCGFYLFGDTSCNPGVMLVPINYNGALVNYDESITLTGFPQCPYTNDAFAAYLSQMATGGSLTNLGASLGTAVAGDPRGLLPVVGSLVDTGKAAVMPNQAKGSSNNATLFSANALNFFYCTKRVTEEFARIIDGYFNMYGYATHRVKQPNRSSRPHWNYVKTKQCVITGGVPADDLSKIQSIYNNGVTFWKKGSEVGNYTLDNRPA